MKKVLFPILVFVLCLSLCACGGMSGEKAAELYPDIIGEWGTDPFGEEFVLTLSKNGSCTVLGTEGTWKLDSKQTDEECAVLTIKTENLKYYVELDRVQQDRRYQYNSVNLLIMDAKQETHIYEGYVFTQEENFVFPELAIQSVPELIGEWGSHYLSEETALTIREDGTCTVLRQPGKWCLRRDFSTWPKIVIVMKLENGLIYESEFFMEDNIDFGYTRVGFDIYNRTENIPVIIDPEADASFVSAIDRSKVIHPMEVASIAVGEWAEDENKQSFAAFREDGTCTIRGADGLWTLDYTAYYNEKYRNLPFVGILKPSIYSK